MGIETTITPVLWTGIHIHHTRLAVPAGYSVGAVAHRLGSEYRYVIRDRDGASVLCRATPCDDECLPVSQLEEALDAEMDYQESEDRHQEEIAEQAQEEVL